MAKAAKMRKEEGGEEAEAELEADEEEEEEKN